jgi:hypothetical protein
MRLKGQRNIEIDFGLLLKDLEKGRQSGNKEEIHELD